MDKVTATANTTLPLPTPLKALPAVKALVFGIDEKASPDDEAGDKSKQLPEDVFASLLREKRILEPPFDLFVLSTLPEQNTELEPCLDAMETNIEGFGHRLVSRVNVQKADKLLASAVKAEKVRLENFFLYAGMEHSFKKLRYKRRRDLEKTGNAYWEVVRDVKGRVQFFVPMRSYQLRLTAQDAEAISVDMPILELQDDGRSLRVVKIKAYRRFRRFVQVSATVSGTATISGYKQVWFKQLGDPRTFDKDTGELVPHEKLSNWNDSGKPMPDFQKANEVIHWAIDDSRSPYGLPRYIGILLDIFGDRKASEINYVTFCNNNVPSMIISVSNGQLTQETVDRIRDFIEKVQASDNRSTVLVLEAESSEEEGEDSGNIKIEVKPLTKEQITDAQFLEYSKHNREKVRVAFRLPPILIGRCHSADTEYLTENGWLSYREIEDGTKLATFNKATGALEFQLPTERFVYDWDGPALHLYNQGIDALVTPHHRFWTRPTSAKNRSEKPWSMVEGRDLSSLRGANGGYLELPVSALWNGQEEKATYLLPGSVRSNARDPKAPSKNSARDAERAERAAKKAQPREVPVEDLFRLVGYYVSEGSILESSRGVVFLSQNVGDTARKMTECLHRLGFTPTVVESRPGQLNISVCDAGLWGWLQSNCGAGSQNKRIPRWMLNASVAQLEILLDAMVEGDGSIPRLGSEGSFQYSTTSSALRDGLHEICVRLGIALTSRLNARTEPEWAPIWRIYGHYAKVHLVHPVDQIQEVHYAGEMACFAVPNDTLITRRNGRVLISGNTEDYTRTTAETSRRLADEQVFAPERDDFDDWVNRILFPEMGVMYHLYRSNSPNTTDNTELVKILAGAEKTGGMTPRIARMVLEDILGRELADFTEGFDPDVPFSLTMAEAVKNQADPTEPGQQVTALKRLKLLSELVGEEAGGGMVVQTLLDLRKTLEDQWSKELFASTDEEVDEEE